jgi:CheY-like chemotaxis protein
VLCVDDDAAIVRLLTRWLRRAGYDAAGTSHPLNAIEQLVGAASPFDALITDQNMPGMTGLELARLATSARPRLVVFLATAKSDCLHLDELATSGVSYLVAKPFDLPSVVASLGEVGGIPPHA